jgi:Mrp family chromosome partitioning ATPase
VLLIETSNDLSKNEYVEGAGEGECSSAVDDTTLSQHSSPPNAECQVVDRLDLDRLLTHTAMPGVDSLVLHGASLPREVFATSFMTDLLRELRERYTLVLLGGPDISHSVDVELLAASVDGIVFYSDGKQVGSAAEAVHELQGLQAPILGITG